MKIVYWIMPCCGMEGIVVLQILIFSSIFVHCDKKRIWLGPDSYFEGATPSARYGSAAIALDNKLLIHGGAGPTGDSK